MQDIDFYPSELAKSRHSLELKLLLMNTRANETRAFRTFRSSLKHASIGDFIKSSIHDGKNRPYNDRPILETLFNAYTDHMNVSTNSPDIAAQIRGLVNALLQLEITNELRRYLVALQESVALIESGVERKMHGRTRNNVRISEQLKKPCCYAYTYERYMKDTGYSGQILIPIKIGFSGRNGAERIAQQVNASTPQIPEVLYCWPATDKYEARSNEKRLHAALVSHGFERTHGGGTEWFEVSIDALHAIADEIGLKTMVLKSLEDYKK